MKRIILILGFTFLSLTAAFAQRLAFVDSDYILKRMPEYISAQKQIAALSEQWQKEVDQRYQEIDRLYKAFQADEVLMTADMKRRRQAEIADKEKTVKTFQQQRFGPEGDLAQRSTSMMKPIQEKLAKAIQAVAENENLDMVFDKNSEVMMLYANPRYNKSDEVLIRLGLKPGTPVK